MLHRSGPFLLALALAGVLLPLLVVWVPELRYNWVSVPKVNGEVVRAAMMGLTDKKCALVGKHDLSSLADAAPDAVRASLAALERRETPGPPGSWTRSADGFDPVDLTRGGGSEQLQTASLVTLDLHLKAWQQTGNPRHLERARDYLTGWWDYEAKSWSPVGLQWNDHAVAARVFVLTRYLCATRKAPLDPTGAETALAAIIASGERLMKPRYFTYRTNHGVMQNLALLHIGAMFPALPQTDQFAKVGVQRFSEQLDVYLSPEGAINEHSAGYHSFGLRLLRMAIDTFTIFERKPPAALLVRYEKALDLDVQLRRPDGTLPAWGDTVRSGIAAQEEGAARTSSTRARKAAWLGPVSGVAVWWQERSQEKPAGPASQTLVTWSNFATQAHKHLDEMAIFVWTSDSDILIGSGYWPNDRRGRNEATGWSGANAPRFVAEPPAERGTTRLVGFVSSEWLEGIDLERVNDRGGILRRQIFFLRPNRWIVIDHGAGKPGQEIETTWVLDPKLTVRAVDRSSFILRVGDRQVAHLQLGGCDGGSSRIVKGVVEPFAGWTAADGTVVETQTILRRCPLNRPAILTMVATDDSPGPGQIGMAMRDAENWEVRAAVANEPLLVRSGGEVRGSSPTCGRTCSSPMIQTPDAMEQRDAINRAFLKLASDYRRYPEGWLPYRVRITKVLGAAWVALLSIIAMRLVCVRRRAEALDAVLGVGAIAFWILAAAWLQFVYFV